jgi:hypothetical protein
MLLGGLWHGASWTFVVWGGLHGLYLVINHGWRALCSRLGFEPGRWLAFRLAAQGLTFGSVVVAFVLFRADTLSTGGRILGSMAGLVGFEGRSLLTQTQLEQAPLLFGNAEIGILAALLATVWLLPNTQELMGYRGPGHGSTEDPGEGSSGFAFEWSPSRRWGVAVGLMALLSLVGMSQAQEFVYFRF